MTVTELVKDMTRFVEGRGVITRTELAAYLGIKDTHYVAKYLYGLERIGRAYFIRDVAMSLKAGCKRFA